MFVRGDSLETVNAELTRTAFDLYENAYRRCSHRKVDDSLRHTVKDGIQALDPELAGAVEVDNEEDEDATELGPTCQDSVGGGWG